MRVLVTGASGLLGLNLALEAAREHTVIGVVNRHRLRTEAFTVLEADLLDPGAIEKVLEEARPDWIIHCAALAIIDACEADPALAQRVNTELPEKLAHVAKGGARLLHVSTDAVFDGQKGGYTEADEPNPLSHYARTKLAAERAVLAANPEAMVARVNLYGWSLLGQRSLSEFFYHNLSAGRRVNGFTDVYFCPLLANQLGRLMLKMLDRGLEGLYHAVSPDCLTKYDFGAALARRFGFDEGLINPISVEESGLQAARSPRLTLKTEKLAAALGEPLPGLEAGIEELYRQYLQGYPALLRRMGSLKE